MHLVLFTMDMAKGGTERVISNLCNEYLVNRYQVSIVSYLKWNCEYSLDRKVRTYSLEACQSNHILDKCKVLLSLSKKYCRLILEIKADIILAFLPRPCLLACIMRKKAGIPVIGCYRSNPEYDLRNPVYRVGVKRVYDRADGFVFQTSQAKEFFQRKLRKKSTVIMNPVNARMVREQYHGKRSKRIVCVGRTAKEKNYPLLLEAFSKVDRKYQEYTLWIYGKYDEQLGLKELSEVLSVADRVFFAGQKDDIYNEIYDASLFVLPSRTEGVPNALMEAMAMGLPVIATDCPCGGPRELIQNGWNGMLVPNEDELSLLKAIEEMLADQERALQMGVNAQKTIARYSGEIIYKKWEDYILHVWSFNKLGTRK